MAYEPASSFWQVVGYWQTLITGLLAVAAAFGTIIATIWTAKREISAAQEQVKTAQVQIDTTLRLERRRIAQEAWAFLVALEAAANLVIERIDTASKRVAPNTLGYTQPAYHARQQLKQPAFVELRSACIRIGGGVTPIFLELDKEIDLFAEDWIPGQSTMGAPLKLGAAESLHGQLEVIRKKAEHLRDEAGTGIRRCLARLAELGDEGDG